MDMGFSGRIKMILLQIAMKESTNSIRSMARGNLFGHQGTCTKEIISKMKETGMERCILLMGQYIKETGAEGSSVVWLK